MAKETPEKLAALREVAHVDARGSPLYRWMWDNCDEFSDIVNVHRPNWQGVTEFFVSQGFVNAEGKPLRRNAVVQTWERVKRRRGVRKAGKKSKPVQEPPVNPVDPRPRTSPASLSSPVVSESDRRKAQNDSDAVMRELQALDEQLNARRQSMPKPIK